MGKPTMLPKSSPDFKYVDDEKTEQWISKKNFGKVKVIDEARLVPTIDEVLTSGPPRWDFAAQGHWKMMRGGTGMEANSVPSKASN